jgi:predicted amidophosphoribosyltransferase
VPTRSNATPAALGAAQAASPAHTLVCPNCHHPIKPGNDICEQCGAVLDYQQLQRWDGKLPVFSSGADSR